MAKIDINKLRLSPSDINSFFFCPRRWYLSIILGIPPMPIPKPELDFGIMVHNIIANYYEIIPEKPTADQIRKTVAKVFKDGYVKIPGTSDRKIKIVAQNFYRFEVDRLQGWKQFRPTFVEKRLEAHPFVGKIDAFWAEEGIVIDWKTGSYSVMHNDLMRQGTIYKLLLEAHGYKVNKVLFVFLYKNKTLEMPATTVGWIEKEIRNMVEMITKGKFPRRNDKLCTRCEFQLACRFDDKHLFEDLEEVLVF